MIKANEYFGGSVKSLALQAEGGPATVGMIEKGEYEFGTATLEIMKIVAGVLDAKLPGSAEWKTYGPGTSFTVQKGQKFTVRAGADVAYLCLYR
jgi:purine/pyrimidine-nucleoside phosphorylase